MNMYSFFLKRLIDFIVVFGVLVIIWPILLIMTLWLHFANRGAGAFLLRNVQASMVRFSKSSNLKR